MHFRPVVVKFVFGVFSEQVHGGQRRNAQFVDFLAGENFGVDIHHRVFARSDDKGIDAGRARAVQQGVDGNRLVVSFRPDQPEFAEDRKFFPGLDGGVDRQPAGGKAVFLMFAECAEVAGAEEGNQFVVIFARVQRVVQAEAGIAQFRQLVGVQAVFAVVEISGGIFERMNAAVDDFVDRNRGEKQ